MGYYEELNSLVFIFINKMLENQEICKLLYYNDENPLSYPDFNSDILLFDRINPYAKRPDPEVDKTAIVNVFLYETKPPTNNKGKRYEDFYIDVICHLDAQKVSGGIRQYSIMNKIDEMFNGKNIEGLSDQKIVDGGALLIYPSEWHTGYRMTYRLYNDANLC